MPEEIKGSEEMTTEDQDCTCDACINMRWKNELIHYKEHLSDLPNAILLPMLRMITDELIQRFNKSGINGRPFPSELLNYAKRNSK